MRLYHGSNIVIDSINLAVRVSKIYSGSPVVNTFEIQDDFRKIEDIKVKDFGLETTEEWAKFVMNNRNRTFTLQDKETGLYMESSRYVYDLFKDEIKFGRIVQAEI